MSKENRASFEQVLEFCNAVREAGGANPLDALMPAIPSNSTACLIARNLNFSCSVCSDGDHGDNTRWYMSTDENIVSSIIASVEGAEPYYDKYGHINRQRVLLPPEIAQVAIDFDTWHQDGILEGSEPDWDMKQFVEGEFLNQLIDEGILSEDKSEIIADQSEY